MRTRTGFAPGFLVSALLTTGCALPASAALTICSTPASCLSAAAGDTFTNITFAQGNLGTSDTDAGGIVFSSLGGLTGVTDISGWPTGTALVGGAGPGPDPNWDPLTITFPSPVNEIEFYVGMQDFSNFTFSITDSNGATYLNGSWAQHSFSTPLFFGITTDGSFTSFTITPQASVDKVTLDDVIYGTLNSGGGGDGGGGDGSETPEGATMLLVASGLFFLRFARRWMPNRLGAGPSGLSQLESV